MYAVQRHNFNLNGKACSSKLTHKYSVAEGLIMEILLIVNMVFNNLFGRIVVRGSVPLAVPAAASLWIS